MNCVRGLLSTGAVNHVMQQCIMLHTVLVGASIGALFCVSCVLLVFFPFVLLPLQLHNLSIAVVNTGAS